MREGHSRWETERERQNNIILKAITMNSPQFRHESTPLSLTRGKEMKEKGEKKEEEKEKQHTEEHTDE